MEYLTLCKKYGIKPISLQEEANLPEAIKSTRSNKVKIVAICEYAESLIKQINRRAVNAPELDDDKHSALVEDYARKVEEMKRVIDEVASYGYM